MKCLKFYSGIGGMRFGLELAGIEAEVLDAFDINELANEIYVCNFGQKPRQARHASHLLFYFLFTALLIEGMLSEDVLNLRRLSPLLIT